MIDFAKIYQYDEDLYVPRAVIQEDIERWLRGDGASDKALYTVSGPPGTGKTWLLHHVREHSERPVLWIDAAVWKEDKRKWFEDFVGKANELLHLNLTASYEERAGMLTKISSACQNHDALIIVDSLEALEEVRAREFEETVLMNLIGQEASVSCPHILVAIREQLYTDALRFLDYTKTSLRNWAKEKGLEQIQRLFAKAQISPPEGASYQEVLFPYAQHYEWQSPRLNACLVKCYIQKESANECQKVLSCFHKFIGDIGAEDDTISKEEVATLIHWAGKLQAAFDRNALPEADDHGSLLDTCLALHLIILNDNFEYEILPGLREAMKDYYDKCENKERPS